LAPNTIFLWEALATKQEPNDHKLGSRDVVGLKFSRVAPLCY